MKNRYRVYMETKGSQRVAYVTAVNHWSAVRKMICWLHWNDRGADHEECEFYVVDQFDFVWVLSVMPDEKLTKSFFERFENSERVEV